MNKTVIEVTERIKKRSDSTRSTYVKQMQDAVKYEVSRKMLSCGNLAHAFAACPIQDKSKLSEFNSVNIGLVTSYNDMLSAHKPFEEYPHELRGYATEYEAVLQVAGGVPAMCDGVTQGQKGMELSLLSRDTIALSTSIALSHNMFDASALLGTCDKIVPGLLIGALKFANLPTLFVPAGPMPTGISNKEKAFIRQQYAEGKIGRKELLEGESKSYHSAGTCTFYGTANSNQMLLEIMGLQLPGSSFVNPGTELRHLLNKAAIKQLVANATNRNNLLYEIVSEETIVNGIVGLLATGGSTNHAIHLVAIARAAGIIINWDDFSDLSNAVPLICNIYPNGSADINQFHACGGMSFVVKTLLENGYLHSEVETIIGKGLHQYMQEPKIENGGLVWVEGASESLDETILRPAEKPFSAHGGLKLMQGNIGRAVIKTSALADEDLAFTAPAVVFDEQNDLITAFKNGELDRDFVAVFPYQGPKANGMPELHKLTPTLSVLLKRGYNIAMITDGRMSGASGIVPAAIHVTPEAHDGGLIGKLRTGDIINFDIASNTFSVQDIETVEKRNSSGIVRHNHDLGTELFAFARKTISDSEQGASFIL